MTETDATTRRYGPPPKNVLAQSGVPLTLTDTQAQISQVCRKMAGFLIDKNRAYGDSALDPVRVFSKADVFEQLYVRIDDKLSRFMRGHNYPGDDDIDDLLGYLLLLKVAKLRVKEQEDAKIANKMGLDVKT